jgi:hypothetical protein
MSDQLRLPGDRRHLPYSHLPVNEWPDDMTLGEARALLADEIYAENWQDCHLCGRLVKVWPIQLNANMARGLIAIWRENGTGYVHVPSLKTAGHEESKAEYWGLISEEPSRRADGGRPGWWRLAPLGVRFIHGQAYVPQTAHRYDGETVGHSGPAIGIQDALGKRFNWRELMDL